MPSTASRLYKEGRTKTLAILGGCTGLSKSLSLLITQVLLSILSCAVSNVFVPYLFIFFFFAESGLNVKSDDHQGHIPLTSADFLQYEVNRAGKKDSV